MPYNFHSFNSIVILISTYQPTNLINLLFISPNSLSFIFHYLNQNSIKHLINLFNTFSIHIDLINYYIYLLNHIIVSTIIQLITIIHLFFSNINQFSFFPSQIIVIAFKDLLTYFKANYLPTPIPQPTINSCLLHPPITISFL